jgi:hypothetical protein
MEKLQIEFGGVWHHIEVLRWMERNTRKFKIAFRTGLELTVPLASHYQSERKIAELVGHLGGVRP